MILAKVLLVVHGVVTLVYGVLLWVNPSAVADYMGLQIVTDDGTAELVTMYVGMSGTLSLFMLYGAFKRKWLNQATLFLALSMTGIAVGRALSFVMFSTDDYTRNALFYDIPLAGLAWIAYMRLNKAKQSDATSSQLS